MSRLIALCGLVLFYATSHAAEVPYKKFIKANAANISKIHEGMTKDQVMSTMGSDTSKVPDGKLGNPYKMEFFQRDASKYEVLFYLTRIHPPFTLILDNQSTPVILKDGVVMGVGRAALSVR